MADSLASIPLFGGSRLWDSEEWIASDDRVRGGSSQSYLVANGDSATFRGNLDTETLGGAGFASQRTSKDDAHWNLAGSHGLQLVIDPSSSDDKKYTLIVKDELLPPNPENGREQSTTSWEFDFQPSQYYNTCSKEQAEHVTIFIPWDRFQPTYRGRPSSPTAPLCVSEIKRFSIMMRSFFGSQQGDFHLKIWSIAARSSNTQSIRPATSSKDDAESIDSLTKPGEELGRRRQPSLWSRLLGCGHL